MILANGKLPMLKLAIVLRGIETWEISVVGILNITRDPHLSGVFNLTWNQYCIEMRYD